MISYEEQLKANYNTYLEVVEAFITNAVAALIDVYQSVIDDNASSVEQRSTAAVVIAHIRDNVKNKHSYLIHADLLTHSLAATGTIDYFNVAKYIQGVCQNIRASQFAEFTVENIEAEVERLLSLKLKAAEHLGMLSELRSKSSFEFVLQILHDYTQSNEKFNFLADSIRLPTAETKVFNNLKAKGALKLFRSQYPERLISYLSREELLPQQVSLCLQNHQFQRLDLSVFGVVITDEVVEKLLKRQNSGLQSLNLSHTLVTDKVLSVIAKQSPGLQKLVLTHLDHLTLQFESTISLPALEILDLSYCSKLSGFSLSLPSLKQLILSRYQSGRQHSDTGAGEIHAYLVGLKQFLDSRANNKVVCQLVCIDFAKGKGEELRRLLNTLCQSLSVSGLEQFDAMKELSYEHENRLSFKDVTVQNLALDYKFDDSLSMVLNYCASLAPSSKVVTSRYDQAYYHLMRRQRFYLLLAICKSYFLSADLLRQKQLITALTDFINSHDVGYEFIIALFVAIAELDTVQSERFIVRAFTFFVGLESKKNQVNCLRAISGFVVKLLTFNRKTALANRCLTMLADACKNANGNYNILVDTLCHLVQSENPLTSLHGQRLVSLVCQRVGLKLRDSNSELVQKSLIVSTKTDTKHVADAIVDEVTDSDFTP